MKKVKPIRYRQDPRWPDAHISLRQAYEARVPDGISQAEFGATYGLGSQGMVWQYLNGFTPLNYDAAAKFARGLQCTIREISPQMADALEAHILPVLGRRARKIAGATVLALLSILPISQHSASQASEAFTNNTDCRRLLRWLFVVLRQRRAQVTAISGF